MEIPSPIVPLNGAVGASVLSAPEPPRSAAGFVHSTCGFGGGVSPNASVRTPDPFPKIASSGGALLKAEWAITQPVWRPERQAGTCLNTPPTLRPAWTVTL